MTKKVTELPVATTPLAGADILLVVQGGVSKQSPVSGLPVSGGSLTNWTEAVSTSAPNATVPVTSFTSTNAATNVDAAIVAKGNGATLANVPDNTATGGNKRGIRATDLQRERSANTHVSSGNYSVIAGGNNNTASGTSSIAGGTGSTASGTNSVALGNECTASAIDSHAYGRGSTSRALIGSRSFSSRSSAGTGDSQVRKVTLARTTTNATPVVITSDNGAASSSNQLDIPIRSTFLVRGRVSAHNSTSNDAKAWEFNAVLKSTTGGTVSLVSAVTPTVIAADAGAASWDVTVAADNTLKVLQVTVTGNTTGSTRFNCYLESVEVAM